MSRDPIVVVGSGASGVHFAITALEKGRRVVMVDVGRRRPPPVRPDASFRALKGELDDAVPYLLGDDYRALILPDHDDEYYGFPPGKDYVFRGLKSFEHRARGFAPLFSFAQGGLAEAWTGGSYPFHDGELREFPFGLDELLPFYGRVARRIGISGALDDMARFFPAHDALQPPLDLDEHSRRLLEAYARRKAHLNDAHRCFIGRARLATLTRDLDGRKACGYLGRCLWGCPTESLYTPSLTLRECMARDSFEYRGGWHATRFTTGDDGRIKTLHGVSTEDGRALAIDVGTLVLAAGTLSTAKIVLDSVRAETGELVELRGLMDNRQVLMPFVNLGMIGRPFDPDTYQYHQLAIGLDRGGADDYVHGLVTTLKTALVHPVVPSLPFALRTSLRVFRNIHAALGLVNINFSDHRRETNRVGLEVDGATDSTRLLVHYEPAASERDTIGEVCAGFRRILRRLSCLAPKGMTHLRPMGASVHYAGTMPMSRDGGRFTTDESCKSRDFENLYLVDGTTFPSLPAKNLTFTLMANATRVAEKAF